MFFDLRNVQRRLVAAVVEDRRDHGGGERPRPVPALNRPEALTRRSRRRSQFDLREERRTAPRQRSRWPPSRHARLHDIRAAREQVEGRPASIVGEHRRVEAWFERGGGGRSSGIGARSTATRLLRPSHSPPVRARLACALASVFCACLTSSSENCPVPVCAS